MPRMVVPIIIVVLIIGALVFLSTLPKQRPTQTIEVPVTAPAAPGGNAH